MVQTYNFFFNHRSSGITSAAYGAGHGAQGTGRRAQGTGRRAQSKRLRDEGTARLQDNVSCIIGDVPHWKRPARLARPARPA